MREEIESYISKMRVDGNLENIYRYTYRGRGVSTNQYYNSGHWRTRNNIKNKYRDILSRVIDDNPIKGEIDNFGLVMFYNSRHDTDNVIGFGKIFVDVLKDVYKVLKEDNKYHYKMCMSVPDLNLDMNTFEFVLIDYGSN